LLSSTLKVNQYFSHSRVVVCPVSTDVV
jgi:hypothetical protein